MKKIFWDLDGVLRDLSGEAREEEPSTWYETINGVDLVTYISNNLGKLLSAKPTEYVEVFLYIRKHFNPCMEILTVQPELWRNFTLSWIQKYLRTNNVRFTSSAEKIAILKNNNAILIEDFPFFKDYTNVLLIDKKYNQEVENVKRIKSPKELKIEIIKFLK